MAKQKRPSKRGKNSDPKPMVRTRLPGEMPSKDEILAFIASSSEKVGKREIAKAFGIKGGEKIGLKALLGEMAGEGRLVGNRKHLREKGQLPAICVLEVVDRDDGGDLIAEPVVWELEDGPRPRVLVQLTARVMHGGDGGFAQGDRFLARVERREDGEAEGGITHLAEPIKKLPREKKRLLGIFIKHPRGGGSINPIERRDMKTWPVRAGDEGDAADGDLVRFDIARRHAQGVPSARVAESLGNPGEQRQVSLIAVHAHGIPDEFPERVLAELDELPKLSADGRLDLTGTPLLTIDPVDARDHDDAVAARPDDDPKNAGGFIVTVAIADVAHYVRPGSRIDREAELRGNSVYFPDRVVPMLPERISNDLCSLREGEPRPCLVVVMTFDESGKKRRHKFHRAMMRSAAKLSYQEAQAAIDGNVSEKCRPLVETALLPLWEAYRCLVRGREQRAPLNLDLPERKIVMDGQGRVARIMIPERLDAHRLIEEMMIQANVAAAETLEQATTPCVYRVHDRPSKEKMASLADFLATLEMKMPKGEGLRPREFNVLLAAAAGLPTSDLVNEVVLRSQAQAEYAIRNIGHFGLNLERYAHFTSPIRRYADLLVHRALIRALKFGPDGLQKEDEGRLAEVAKAISETERRAMAAERETSDRLLAAFIADRVGAQFLARVSGVTKSGLFVRLKDIGADGFVPASTIEGDYWRHDEVHRALIGDRTGRGFRIGDSVEVRLVEAIPTAGAMRFELLSEAQPIANAGGRGSRQRASEGEREQRASRNRGYKRRR